MRLTLSLFVGLGVDWSIQEAARGDMGDGEWGLRGWQKKKGNPPSTFSDVDLSDKFLF